MCISAALVGLNGVACAQGHPLRPRYHPDNQRGFAPTAERVSYSILQDMGFDVLREFWPEISRKFKLPFRGQAPPVTPGHVLAPNKLVVSEVVAPK